MQFTVWEKIKSKFNRIRKNTIIQFGPPRSGSTLIYNILKDVFIHKSVETRHTYRNKDRKHPTVVTYRNPLDSIVSSILRYNLEPSMSVLEDQVVEFENNGIWTVHEIKDNKNVLMLKYEEFFNDFEIIFDKLEKFFNTKISSDLRKLICSRYNVTALDKISKTMKTFKEIDKKTLIHGKHISIYKGKPGMYKEILKEEQIIYLKKIYKNFLSTFNYN